MPPFSLEGNLLKKNINELEFLTQQQDRKSVV